MDDIPVLRHAVTDSTEFSEGILPIEIVTTAPPKKIYYSSPVVSREHYVHLRTSGVANTRSVLLAQAEERIAEQVDDIAQLKEDYEKALATAQEKSRLFTKGRLARASDRVSKLVPQIRDAQRVMNDLRAQQRTLIANQPNSVTQQVANQEFDQLLKLPNVVAVQLIDGDIAIIITPRIRYHDRVYDLGDWCLRFNATGNFSCRLKRRGLRKRWIEEEGHFSEPSYRVDKKTFCFDRRQSQLITLAEEGQFYELAAIVVESLHYINPEDRVEIPYAFKKIVV